MRREERMQLVVATVGMLGGVMLWMMLLVGIAEADVVIDDGDPATSSQGLWCVSQLGGVNGDSLYSCDDRGLASYHFELPPTVGSVDVQLTWQANSNRGVAIPVHVQDSIAAQPISQLINMREAPPATADGGNWATLGRFTNPRAVDIFSQFIGPGGEASVDAVRLVSVVPSTAVPSPSGTPRLWRTRVAYTTLAADILVEVLADHVPALDQVNEGACLSGTGATCLAFSVTMAPGDARLITLRATRTSDGARSDESAGVTIQAPVAAPPTPVRTLTPVRTRTPTPAPSPTASRTSSPVATPSVTATPVATVTARPSPSPAAPRILEVIIIQENGAQQRFVPAPMATP